MLNKIINQLKSKSKFDISSELIKMSTHDIVSLFSYFNMTKSFQFSRKFNISLPDLQHILVSKNLHNNQLEKLTNNTLIDNIFLSNKWILINSKIDNSLFFTDISGKLLHIQKISLENNPYNTFFLHKKPKSKIHFKNKLNKQKTSFCIPEFVIHNFDISTIQLFSLLAKFPDYLNNHSFDNLNSLSLFYSHYSFNQSKELLSLIKILPKNLLIKLFLTFNAKSMTELAQYCNKTRQHISKIILDKNINYYIDIKPFI
jgi:hypothetical protein